jgi:hypothetical protein
VISVLPTQRYIHASDIASSPVGKAVSKLAEARHGSPFWMFDAEIQMIQ